MTDDMRWPWLDKVGGWLAEQKSGGVAACSALRRAYRDRLRLHSGATTFLHLDGPRDLIRARMVGPEHFMPEALLDSQFATLQRLDGDERGVVLSVQQSPDLIVERFISWARGRSV